MASGGGPAARPPARSSVIGAFFGMQVLGFSINLLTLFGLVLAIGIVVDDAIVVIENVERIMASEGVSPAVAADRAMRQVSRALIAIVLVLCSVFVPVAFLGGITGLMYRQFAITIAIAVVLSGIVALTLTPALCAVLLKPSHPGLAPGVSTDPGRKSGVALSRFFAPPRTCVRGDRKSTRLNSSHSQISYAVFCLKKKK